MLSETFLGQGAEELTERMSWRNLRSHIHLSQVLHTHDDLVYQMLIAHRCRPSDLSIGLHVTDLSIGQN